MGADFTPVCTTELGGLQKASTEFFKRNVKLIAMSCDDVESHIGWIKEIKKLKLSILYPATTGRNVPEILRVIDSLKLTVEKKVATPVNWKDGDKCMVIPSVKPDEAKILFPEHKVTQVPSGKEYLRLTPQP